MTVPGSLLKKIIMSIKEKLAAKLTVLFDEHFNPKDLRRNFGSNAKSDWCSWTGKSVNGTQVCSFTTMTELANDKQPLQFVGGRERIGPSEVA